MEGLKHMPREISKDYAHPEAKFCWLAKARNPNCTNILSGKQNFLPNCPFFGTWNSSILISNKILQVDKTKVVYTHQIIWWLVNAKFLVTAAFFYSHSHSPYFVKVDSLVCNNIKKGKNNVVQIKSVSSTHKNIYQTLCDAGHRNRIGLLNY